MGKPMARTHGLDKRLQEEKEKAAMASTQKLPGHHSYAASTQDSVMPKSKGSGKTYKSGANVSKGSKPSAGKGGVSVAAGPKSGKKGC